jgi:hypothetical protein
MAASPFAVEWTGTVCLPDCAFTVAIFNTWGGYANWSTNIAAQVAELTYKDNMYETLTAIVGVEKADRLGLHGGNFNISISKDEGERFLRSDPTCRNGGFGIRCADNNLHLEPQQNGTYRVHMDSGYLYDPSGWGAVKHGVMDIACGWTFCGGGVPH